MMNLAERNKRILALRGLMKISEIAKQCGVSNQVVSNVFWRADHPRIRPAGPKVIRELGTAAYNAGLTVSDIRALAEQRGAQ
jgi:hypothetical protein